MRACQTSEVSPLVLHVLPIDVARGAQTYARQLRCSLDGDGARHETLTLFRAPDAALRADVKLDVPAGRLRRFGFDPRAAWALRRVVRAEQPAVVVAHGGEPLKYAVLAGVPRHRLVYYKIGVGDARLHGMKRRLHRFFQARACRVAVVSRAAADEAIALGTPSPRVVVIPNGRDPDEYRPGNRDVGDGPVRLVFVGQLDASKRPEQFVALTRALRASGCAVEGVMAGTGPRLAAVHAAAPGAGVEVLGSVGDVPELLAGSDILVFTGGPPEGMPGVLIEAGLAGLPVVTTDVPGAGDVVADGVTGFVVPVDDFAALERATRSLVDDEEQRRAFGLSARARCASEFGLESSVRRWHDLLAEMIAQSCTSST